MESQPTLEDVARVVGVNPRTVSRVLNGQKGYSEETRDRVLAAVQEIGYRPNLAARALMTRQSGTMGLVGGDLADPFFAELAAVVDNELRARGRTMLFAAHHQDPAIQEDVLETLRSHAADGVILFPTPGGLDEIARLVEAGLRVVLVDAEEQAPNVPGVRSQIEAGARTAVDHLIRNGRRRIAMLANVHLASTGVAGMRERGFLQSVTGHLSEDEWMIRHASPTMDSAYLAVEELLTDRPDIDAIFANNDMMAIGALHALSDLGRRVPEDVALVGYNDLRIASETRPALTTVRIDREAVAAAAVELLCRTDTPPPGPAIEIPTELIVRDSG